MRFRTKLRCLALGAAALLFPQAGSAVGPYHVTDLGVLFPGHVRSVAEGINEYGQVVGVSNSNLSASDRAFLWQPDEPNGTDGTIHYLGDLAGGAEQSFALGLNDLGQVVGRSHDNLAERAFLWQPSAPNQPAGTLVNLGDLPGGGNLSSAGAINNQGQIVGFSQATPGLRGFFWQPTSPNATTGTFTELGDLPGGEDYSVAHHLNQIGQIVGSSWMSTGRHPTLQQPLANDGTVEPIDLGSLPGGAEDGSEGGGAVEINAAGVIVGSSLASTGYRAFLWQPDSSNAATGTMVDLGDLPGGDDYSLARSINSVGQVVGLASSVNFRAFYWDIHLGMVDLNDYLDPISGDGWILEDARGINDSGQIVGYGRHNGVTRAYLLTPHEVPEPASIFLLISMLFLTPSAIRAR